MSKEKLRVYELARELKMESKDLLDMCRQANIPVKNQLSSLDHDQRETLEKMVHRKPTAQPPPAPPPPIATVLNTGPIATLVSPRVSAASAAAAAAATATATATAVAAPPVAPPAAPPPPPVTTVAATTTTLPPVSPPRQIPSLHGSTHGHGTHGRMRDLNQVRRPPQQPGSGTPPPAAPTPSGDSEQPRRNDRQPRILRPTTITPPPTISTMPKARQAPPPKDEKKSEEPTMKPAVKLTPQQLARLGQGGSKPAEVLKEIAKQAATGIPEVVVAPGAGEDEEDESGDRKRRPGAVQGRDERHKKRTEQQAKRRRENEGTLNLLKSLDDDDGVSARLRRQRQRQIQKPQGTQPRKGRTPIYTPITVRSLSEALGVRASDLLRKLMEHGHMVTINAELTPDDAQVAALDFGCELEVKRPLDPEEQLLAKLAGEDKAEDMVLRAPIVAVMGHVDHGKTSLLDRIRESDVVATEAGGITQHLRAWRVEHAGRPITFLDTPGHEAFTQMRARGANVTDIVVLVVAADDGVMPQTEEAISHARAAGVPIVVAINKVDLPNANLNKTRQQLYSQQLIPDTMGGDTPFVETVATPGKVKGVNELLDMLSLVAELKELKANPKKAGSGTCLEAKLSEGEGVVATLLVRDGTIRQGDVLVCGMAYGRARAMYDDHGKPLEEAGPSMPVRITGMDEVPNADDKFQVVPDLNVAREIAEKRRERLRSAQAFKPATFRLEDLDKAKVAELKVILKADVRGSIEAIKKEMEKLTHDEVRINLLHTGIGAITEGDVSLALASPENTLIVGFNVVPDDRARSLADEKSIQIRQYDIIYNLTDELKSALQGKLKPREEVIHLGRAIVRKTFKISKVGTVAGCYVTQGVIERNARIRLIREGVVIYPPADRTASLDSLKRIKDDAREVREGYDCGIKIAGYDNVKDGDVIEAFRVEQVQRTL